MNIIWLFVFALSTANATHFVGVPTVNCSSYHCNGYCNSTAGTCSCADDYTSAGCDWNEPCCNERVQRGGLFAIAFFFGWTGAPYFMVGATTLGIVICVISALSGLGYFVSGIVYLLNPPPEGADTSKYVYRYIYSYATQLNAATIIWNIVIWAQVIANSGPFRDRMTGW